MSIIGEMKKLTVGDKSYSITVPTKTSQLTNDSGFITSGDIPEGSAASTTSPKMDGTASVGTEMAFARGDHRHPSDTSRVPTTRTVNGKALSSNITLSASDVGALPDDTAIPTKVSDLTNDSGFITGYTETDPTVPSWAKQSSKPTYTASEVGALPSTTVIPSAGTGTSYPAMDGTKSLGTQAGFARVDHVHPTDTSRVPTSRTVNGKALSSNISLTASDVGALPSSTTIPTKTSDLTNDSGFITSSDIPEGSAASTTTPKMNGTASVGTEMAFARGDHVHPSDTSRVPTTRTVNGKALSSNITLSASDVGALPSTTSIPSKISDLTNDSDFVEDASYVHTDNNFTTTLKNKLNGIAEGAEVNVQANWSQTTTTADDYIKNKPTIPTTTSQLTNNSGFITSAALPTKVSDLDNDSGFITSYTETDPTVPAWAKASSKPSYTASEVGAVPTNRTVNGKALSSNITLSASDVSALPASTSIPSKTSDLTNDSGFITGYTETDPTVPSWAKASTKPSYTASEVGAVSKTNGYATDSELLDATTIAAWEDILGIS